MKNTGLGFVLFYQILYSKPFLPTRNKQPNPPEYVSYGTKPEVTMLSSTNLRGRLEERRHLDTLVENKTSFSLEYAEMHIYETMEDAEQIILSFDNPILATMFEGRKIMHLKNKASFDFLPGESLLIPPKELLCVDFPETSADNPTRCMALSVSEDHIKSMIDFLNNTRPKLDGEWTLSNYSFHFTNDINVQSSLGKLLSIFMEDHHSKDIQADFILQELFTSIMQTENRAIYSKEIIDINPEHRLSYVIQYIRNNLHKDITIQTLASIVYMSESNFYRVFKNELMVSPISFLINERIKKAKGLLKNPQLTITEITKECGFNSLSYFNRIFKRVEKISPKEYRKQMKQKIFTKN